VQAKAAADRQGLEAQTKEHQRKLDEGRKRLPELIPEWQDAAVAKRESASIAEYLTTKAGMTATDLGNLTDPRAIVIARNAWLYAELQKSKPAVQKKVAKAAPMTKPGASTQQRGKSEGLKAARAQLRKTGSVRDAARAFEQLLD
jgi:hypothetical protein